MQLLIGLGIFLLMQSMLLAFFIGADREENDDDTR